MTRRPRKVLRDKTELLKLAETLGNVSAACRQSGISRDTYYRLKRAFDDRGVVGLRETTRRKPNLKKRIAPEIEEKIIELSLQSPQLGKKKISETLVTSGVRVSPAGVRAVWLRHKIETFPQRQERIALLSSDCSSSNSQQSEDNLHASLFSIDIERS